MRGKRLNKSSHLNTVQRRRAEKAERHGERYVKEERSTVQWCRRPRPGAADGTKAACHCQEAWLMIALHGGYKANIKAALVAAHHFKGCGGGWGGGGGARPAPSARPPPPFCWPRQVTGNKATRSIPVAEPHLFLFRVKNFASSASLCLFASVHSFQTLLNFRSVFTPPCLQVDLLTVWFCEVL